MDRTHGDCGGFWTHDEIIQGHAANSASAFSGNSDQHPAQKHISANFVANLFGLGWAATPPGLMAMKSMSDLNQHRQTASNSMCTFMIVNMSSLQLIPINMIAYRSQYGSINPSAIVAPALIATFISTLAGVIAAKLLEKYWP